ncbi:DHH family phosphoesterase [Methanobacterium sp. ACI-7]|uniref:DHH family phosphoesterase n=1 Tax=unclassified Methanobacterium TaxID=2627676 RepID=UPI0039C34030
MTQEAQHSLLNRADEACALIQEHIKKDHIVRVISHNDSDGLSSAGVICNAISKQGGKFHVTIIPRLKEEFIKKLSKERYNLFVFCDMGSAYPDLIARLKGNSIICDHHQIPGEDGEKYNNLIHVNPHLYGMDGTRDVSASGVSYISVRGMGNEDLSGLALVGAFGDMQCADEIQGVNKMILDEGIKAGIIEEREGLKITYKREEPIYKALAYSFNPALKGISGNPDGAKAFLEEQGLSYGIKFEDLAPEEKDLLKEELIKINPKIFDKIYSVPRETKELKDIEDYSRILDACGKNKKYGAGVSICIGEREGGLEEGLKLAKKYRDNLVKGIDWINKEGSIQLDNIQYIYTEDKEKKRLMGTIASIGIDLEILDPQKPVITISKMHDIIKVSGRTTMEMVQKGVNLGYALGEAAKSFNGNGGGHTIAAGAVAPFKDMDNFTDIVDEIVGTQINK